MGKSYEIEGKIKVIDEIQTFSSGFSKREFVVEVEDGKYPQMIKFECLKEKTSLTDGLQIDDSVKITFDIRGSEYKERYYVNLVAWKLEREEGGPSSPTSSSASPKKNQPDYGDEDAPSDLSEPSTDYAEEEDDIPF